MSADIPWNLRATNADIPWKLQVYSDKGFATLYPDGTAQFDWVAIRQIAASVIARKSTDPLSRVEAFEAIAALVWAAANPGIKP